MRLTTSTIVHFIHKDDKDNICLVQDNDSSAGQVLYVTCESGKLYL